MEDLSVRGDEGTRDMIDIDPDAGGGRSGSVLVTGPAQDRFERATELLSGDVVVVPGVGDDLEAALATAELDSVSLAPRDGDVPPLSQLGIELSDLVAERSRPHVLVDADAIVAAESVCPYSLFRFLHLVRWRVASAGGRLVCTLGDEVDPITVETIDEVFDERARTESIRDRRTVGELSP